VRDGAWGISSDTIRSTLEGAFIDAGYEHRLRRPLSISHWPNRCSYYVYRKNWDYDPSSRRTRPRAEGRCPYGRTAWARWQDEVNTRKRHHPDAFGPCPTQRTAWGHERNEVTQCPSGQRPRVRSLMQNLKYSLLNRIAIATWQRHCHKRKNWLCCPTLHWAGRSVDRSSPRTARFEGFRIAITGFGDGRRDRPGVCCRKRDYLPDWRRKTGWDPVSNVAWLFSRGQRPFMASR